ncbi:MAG TPA: hypothetical protein VNZ45_15475, partial [Bacteroidia bacterium]|nr:hypothetical protein [Bacteroidia bacterium]
MPTLSETMLMLSRKLQGLPIEEPKPIDKYDYSNPNSLPLLPWQPGGSEYVSYEDILKSKEAAKRFDRDCIRPIYNPSLFSALPFEEVAKLVDKRVKITNLKYVYNYCLESHAKSFDFTFIVSCNYHTLNGKKINPNTFRKLLKILEKAKVIEKLSNGDNQWRYDEGERMHMASVYRWVTASERAYTLNDECEAPTALVEANNTI